MWKCLILAAMVVSCTTGTLAESESDAARNRPVVLRVNLKGCSRPNDAFISILNKDLGLGEGFVPSCGSVVRHLIPGRYELAVTGSICRRIHRGELVLKPKACQLVEPWDGEISKIKKNKVDDSGFECSITVDCRWDCAVAEHVPVGEPMEVVTDATIYSGLSRPEARALEFSNDLALARWLQKQARNRVRLLGLIPLGVGNSIFVSSQDIEFDSIEYYVMTVNEPLTVARIQWEFELYWPGRSFVGVHRLEPQAYAMVFKHEKR